VKSSLCIRLWDTFLLIHGEAVAFVGIALKYWCTWESWSYHCGRSSVAYLPFTLGIPDSLGDMDDLCQDMRQRLRNMCVSPRISTKMIEVQVHIRLTTQRVGWWDVACIFLATLLLTLLLISWAVEDVQQQVWSVFQWCLRILDWYEANFDNLRFIMDVSFHPMDPSSMINLP